MSREILRPTRYPARVCDSHAISYQQDNGFVSGAGGQRGATKQSLKHAIWRTMIGIAQHLWFERDTEAAVRFYTSLVPAGRIHPKRRSALAKRVTEAMLRMTKFAIAVLEAAARQSGE